MDAKPTGEGRGPPLERWERTFGDHTMSLEAPDILILRIKGDLEEAHVGPIREELNRVCRELPYVFGLVDMSRMGTITASARKAAAAQRNPPNLSNAVFGASFTQRVLIQLVIKAVRVLRGVAPTMGMFETEVEARAWIHEQRRARSQALRRAQASEP